MFQWPVIIFGVETLKLNLEKQYFEEEKELPWFLNPDTS